MKDILKTAADTVTLAGNFVRSLTTADSAVVVGLHGDLGSGKTTFTQAAAKALGVVETVNSPTFIIQKKYPLPQAAGLAKKQSFKHLVHIDAYRLERPEELIALGWKDLLKDPGNLIFVEWPERVASIMPNNVTEIQFTFVDETTRKIVVRRPHDTMF